MPVVHADEAAHQGVAVVEARGAEVVADLAVDSVDEGAVEAAVRQGVRRAAGVGLAVDEVDGAATVAHSLCLYVFTFCCPALYQSPLPLHSWRTNTGVLYSSSTLKACSADQRK